LLALNIKRQSNNGEAPGKSFPEIRKPEILWLLPAGNQRNKLEYK